MILLLIIEFDLMHFPETWLGGRAHWLQGAAATPDDGFFRFPQPDARAGRVDQTHSSFPSGRADLDVCGQGGLLCVTDGVF